MLANFRLADTPFAKEELIEGWRRTQEFLPPEETPFLEPEVSQWLSRKVREVSAEELTARQSPVRETLSPFLFLLRETALLYYTNIFGEYAQMNEDAAKLAVMQQGKLKEWFHSTLKSLSQRQIAHVVALQTAEIFQRATLFLNVALHQNMPLPVRTAEEAPQLQFRFPLTTFWQKELTYSELKQIAIAVTVFSITTSEKGIYHGVLLEEDIAITTDEEGNLKEVEVEKRPAAGVSPNQNIFYLLVFLGALLARAGIRDTFVEDYIEQNDLALALATGPVETLLGFLPEILPKMPTHKTIVKRLQALFMENEPEALPERYEELAHDPFEKQIVMQPRDIAPTPDSLFIVFTEGVGILTGKKPVLYDVRKAIALRIAEMDSFEGIDEQPEAMQLSINEALKSTDRYARNLLESLIYPTDAVLHLLSEYYQVRCTVYDGDRTWTTLPKNPLLPMLYVRKKGIYYDLLIPTEP